MTEPAQRGQMVRRRVHIHVGAARCQIKHCGWTGYHFHWRHRRYRTAFAELGFEPALPPEMLPAYDADCAADKDGWRNRDA